MFKKLILSSLLLFALCGITEAATNRVGVVNKFGYAPSGVQATATDVWDLADATPTQQIWVAPTAARVHAIVSSSTSDDGAPVGVGARTMRVYGLKTWATAETSEDIILNGTTPVNTVNSYVIIHRMKVLTKGATNANVGNIKATAATDSTITAQINAGEGQTLMAIYGIPSTQNFIVDDWYGSINKSSGSNEDVLFSLKVNPGPDTELINFLTKERHGLENDGTSCANWPYPKGMDVAGPAIIKVQCVGSAADLDVAAGFHGFLEEQ